MSFIRRVFSSSLNLSRSVRQGVENQEMRCTLKKNSFSIKVFCFYVNVLKTFLPYQNQSQELSFY